MDTVNRRINKKSYHIAGLPKALARIVLRDLGGLKAAEEKFQVDDHALRRAYATGNVSRALWSMLLKPPQFRDELAALCPEGWGGEGSRTARARTSSPTPASPALGLLAPGLRLPGENTTYIIERRIEGFSRTSSFLATDDTGNSVFIKTLLDVPSSPTQKAKADIEMLETRFKREVVSHNKLKAVPRIAHVLGHNQICFAELPYPVPFLVQEFIEGLKFDEYMLESGAQGAGRLSAEQWFQVARLLLETLRSVHACGVIHGDICPDNILFRDGEPVFVDFGQSFILDTHFLKPADLEHSRQLEYVAPERRAEGGKWSLPADIYGLGGVLLYLACGKEPSLPQPDNHALRTYVFQAIERRNPALLSANTLIADVILRCLHFSLEDRAASAEEVLEFLTVCEHAASEPPQASAAAFEQELKIVRDRMEFLKDENRAVFLPFLLADIRLIARRLTDVIAGNFFSVVGDREEVILGLLRYLSLLSRNDRFFTVTIPDFWRDHNLGVEGRFLRFNAMLAKRGVSIRRVFLLTHSDLKDPFVHRVMQAQIELLKSLPSSLNTAEKEEHAGGVYIGFVVVRKAERERLIRHGHTVGLASIGSDWMALIFKPNEKDGKIRRVDLRIEANAGEAIQSFKTYLARSEGISALALPRQNGRDSRAR